MIQSKTYIAVPPGETIKEQLCIRGMSQQKFCEKMEMSSENTNRLLNGSLALTSDLARRLERVLDVPSFYWERLENKHREIIHKIEIENDEQIIKKISIKINAKTAVDKKRKVKRRKRRNTKTIL